MRNNWNSAGVVLIVCIAFTSIPSKTSAQCKAFVREQITMLSPFVYSGKTNTATLMPGDHSELSLVFYAGQTYRIVMKSAESPADVSFTIKDANKNLIFKSDDGLRSYYYDFTSESTQMLTIDMVVADKNLLAQNASSQCVVVLVGHKE